LLQIWNRADAYDTERNSTDSTFLRIMYGIIEVNDANVEKLMEVVRCERHTSYEGMLELPFEQTEIYRAIQAVRRAEKGTWKRRTRACFYSHS
jgi:hypothetical protein